jgi:hypothetical protein
MKSLILAFFLLSFFSYSNAQNQSENFNIEIDDFTEAKKIKQKVPLPLYSKDFSYVFVSLAKVDEQIVCSFDFSKNSSDLICVNDNCKAMVKLENGDVLELANVAKTDCDKSVRILVMIGEDNVSALSEKRIDKLRLYTTDGYLDFIVDEIISKNYMSKKFFKTYIGKNPKDEFITMINELSKL